MQSDRPGSIIKCILTRLNNGRSNCECHRTVRSVVNCREAESLVKANDNREVCNWSVETRSNRRQQLIIGSVHSAFASIVSESDRDCASMRCVVKTIEAEGERSI